MPFVVAARARRVVRKIVEQRRWSAKHLRGRFRSAAVFLPCDTIRRVITWSTSTVEKELVEEFGTMAAAMAAVGFTGTALDWYRFGELHRQQSHSQRRRVCKACARITATGQAVLSQSR